ncbi:hypothetical protein CVT24_003248 [Panaeolus cyanescens]|uniref:peptidylprolyl isomerase n=1 Tax=Panaeolus cyanescens TaxID=181874 RepID=A0A409YXJ9_9AGAR|nr:hypothetical protein CVT24_003248 [Panaeolus cyanescens]
MADLRQRIWSREVFLNAPSESFCLRMPIQNRDPKRRFELFIEGTGECGMTITAVEVYAIAAIVASPKRSSSPGIKEQFIRRLDLEHERIVQYINVKEGVGLIAGTGDTAHLHYICRLGSCDGDVYDENTTGSVGFPLVIGTSNKDIKGLSEGIMGMRVGGERIVFIPKHIACWKKGGDSKSVKGVNIFVGNSAESSLFRFAKVGGGGYGPPNTMLNTEQPSQAL